MAPEQPAIHPLDGVRVIDFTRVLAGPLCTMVLGDLGADVIKVERPEGGDDTRHWGPPFLAGDAAYYLSVNRNKRSITLDLEIPEDLTLAQRLVAGADVVVENFRPGVMERFGLGAASSAARNPRLVYCSIPAFGPGPRANEPGYDIAMQALAGYMSFTGSTSGEPAKMGVALLDVITGLYAAIGILAGLRRRDVTGSGELVMVPLFDAGVAALVNQATNHLVGGAVPGPMGTEHPNIVPYQAFAAADGWVVVAVGNDRQYRALCETLGLRELGTEPRFATNAGRVEHRDELVPQVAAAISRENVEHWVGQLTANRVPVAPVRDLGRVFSSPEGAALVEILSGMGVEVPSVRSPIRLEGLDRSRPPPRLGEHSEEIRAELEGREG